MLSNDVSENSDKIHVVADNITSNSEKIHRVAGHVANISDHVANISDHVDNVKVSLLVRESKHMPYFLKFFHHSTAFPTFFPIQSFNYCIRFCSIAFAFGSCDLKEIAF